MEKKNVWTVYDKKMKKEADAFGKAYCKFLDNGKTERECIDQIVNRIENEGYMELSQLVKENKWHVSGGWYLQPDCNIPNGESFIRQIAAGREYFSEKFGVYPETAVNFDSFGHTRGLVQILKKCGQKLTA